MGAMPEDNHELFFQVLAPADTATGSFAKVEELLKDFGGLEGFQEQMTDAALSVFGSGYAWLVMDENGLSIMTTAIRIHLLQGIDIPCF